MKILFATYPEKPIFQPMVPMAWALRAAGHEVCVASQPFFTDVITGAGLSAVPVGRQRTDNWRRLTEAFPDRAASERAGLPAPYDVASTGHAPARYADMRDGYRNVLAVWHKQNNVPMINDLVTFAQAWQPDLVIWEATTYAGAIAAKACGAAHARMLWSVDVFGLTRDVFRDLLARQPAEPGSDPLAEWLAAYGAKFGFEFSEDMVTGQFTVDHMPGALRTDAALDYVTTQFVPYSRNSVRPRWLSRPPERPRVALTLGTSTTEWFGDYTFSVTDALDALSDLDVEVIATIASAEQEKLGPVPANTHVVDWVPLDVLAPTCSVMINHAGPSTLLTAALHGIPQLHVPWEFDEPVLAGLAAAQGSATCLRADQVTGSGVREHVVRLLDEPAFAGRAGDLQAQLLALPTPHEAVRDVVERARDHGSSPT